MKRYNLGCGKQYREGWINVDSADKDQWGKSYKVDILHDLMNFPWPFDDGEADEILASHIIEHFDKHNAYDFISECNRILKQKGTLHIAVPHMDKFIMCKRYNNWGPVSNHKWRDLNYLLGGDERERNEKQRHKYMYNFETLAYILEKMGFKPSRRDEPLVIDTSEYRQISLYVDAVKI